MTSMFIPHEPMEKILCMTIIAQLWPIKFEVFLSSSQMAHDF
jgi:hypothetical protein